MSAGPAARRKRPLQPGADRRRRSELDARIDADDVSILVVMSDEGTGQRCLLNVDVVPAEIDVLVGEARSDRRGHVVLGAEAGTNLAIDREIGLARRGAGRRAVVGSADSHPQIVGHAVLEAEADAERVVPVPGDRVDAAAAEIDGRALEQAPMLPADIAEQRRLGGEPLIEAERRADIAQRGAAAEVVLHARAIGEANARARPRLEQRAEIEANSEVVEI